MNILLGVVALLVSRRVEREPSVGESGAEQEETETKRQRPAPREPHPIEISVVIAGFAVSGFVALSYEVIWSRVLALIIGSSVYAFSIMLSTFLVGLAVGSAVGSRIFDRLRKPLASFALLELVVGLTALIGAYLFDQLPFIFVSL